MSQCRPRGPQRLPVRISAAVIGLLLPTLTATAAGQESEPRLGVVDFPTSASPTAQEHFLRGVLWLHSFEYTAAAKAFRQAQAADPDFALAYWGEAMTYNHPVWNQRDREAALTALRRLGPDPATRAAKASTERERRYLEALEVLWAEGPKAERDTAYSLAMERLADAYPEDNEAKAFYSLSLLGLSQGVRVVPTYMRAAAVAEEIFDDNPRHPGAAHYLIHSYDDPIHAPLGLRPARAYSEIAPDAAHAQHMTTHIFLAMGMWDEVVSQNRIAADLTGWGPGHYTSWLGYGLLQQGRIEAARAHLERARANMAANAAARRRLYMASMRGHYIVNSERWDDPALDWEIEVDDLPDVSRAIDSFTQGFAAFKRGDRAGAQAALEQLAAIAPEPSGRDSWGSNLAAVAVLERELRASLALADGEVEGALALMEEATALEDEMPMEFGPPDMVKPSHERLGEMLLSLDRPAEARLEFERALELAPKRALSLLGLARAADAAGDAKTARRAYAELGEIWDEADDSVLGNR